MKQPKDAKFKIAIINVKINSPRRDSKKAVTELLKTVFEKRAFVPVYGDKGMRIWKLFNKEEGKVIEGKFVYATQIESDSWFNQETNDYEDFKLNKNLQANPKEAEFYFIPDAHRLAFRIGKISINSVVKFLDKSLNQFANDDEDVQVIIEPTHDAFEKIVKAKEIRSLKIDVSASNNDLTDDFKKKAFDRELKKANVNRMRIDVNPGGKSKLLPEESDTLIGAISLAQSNGEVEAVIINDNDKREKIRTSNYPLKEYISAQKGFEFHAVYSKIMSIFRP